MRNKNRKTVEGVEGASFVPPGPAWNRVQRTNSPLLLLKIGRERKKYRTSEREKEKREREKERQRERKREREMREKKEREREQKRVKTAFRTDSIVFA